MSQNTNNTNYFQQHQGKWLWLRALLPSTTSLVGSLFFAVTIVGIHLLMLSMNPELAVQRLFGEANDQLIQTYTGSFLEPVDRAFGSQTLSTLTTALLWGTVGWVIYAVLDFIITTVKEVRSADTTIVVPGKDKVIKHPLRRTMFIRLLWRFLMGMLVITFAVLAVPFIGRLFGEDVLLLQSTSAFDAIRHGAISILGWMIILHVYIVLFRLFVQRTRVTGEIVF